MKKAFYLYVCFLVSAALCAPLCYAADEGVITDVNVQNGDPATVLVTARFPDNCTMDAQAMATVVGDMVIVQVFTAEPENPCVKGDLQISQKFTPPLHNEYELLVLLYDGIPFDSPVVLLDNETVLIVQEEGACGTRCRETFGQCSDNCSDALAVCKNDCDNDTQCREACDQDFLICADNCSDSFADCKDDCHIDARLDINPDTLNLKSNGRWITAYLAPPAEFSADAINMASVLLENVIAPDWYSVFDAYVMIKFSRAAVVEYINDTYDTFPAYIDLTVRGVMLDDNATAFTATDTIRVINPGRNKNDKDKGNDKDDDDDKGQGNDGKKK